MRALVLVLVMLAGTAGPAAAFGGQGWQHSGRCRGEPRPMVYPQAPWTCTRIGWFRLGQPR